MFRYAMITVVFCLFTDVSSSQSCTVEINVDSYTNSRIILFGYYGQMYPVDTIYLDGSGKGCFAKNYESGMYTMAFPDTSSLDFIFITDSKIRIDKGTNHQLKVTSDNDESIIFNTYHHHINLYLEEIARIREKIKLNTLPEEQQANLKKEVKRLTDSVKILQHNIIDRNESLLISKMLMIMQPVDMSNLHVDTTQSDSARWMQSLLYYRDHFLDNIDFSDARLIRTPMLELKLDEYFDRIVPQKDTELIHAVEEIVKKASKNDEVHDYIFGYVFRKYTGLRRQVKYENVFVHIFDTYIREYGHKDYTAVYLSSLANEARAIQATRIGVTAPELILYDTLQNKLSLYDISSDLTILFFYRTDCPVCDRIIYEMNKILSTYAYLDIKPLAICLEDDIKSWTAFIKTKTMHHWQHVSPLDEEEQISMYYIDLVPDIYLLNNDKQIIAKHLTTGELEHELLRIAVE